MVEKILIDGGEDLGVEYDEVEYAFTFFGKEYRTHPEAGELHYLKFMDDASKITEDNEAEGLPLVMNFLRKQIHPDDFDAFYTVAMEKRQKMNDLMNLSNKILAAQSGFPTKQPSDSRATRRSAARNSKGGSSSAGTRRAPAKRAPTKVPALALLKGRPDQ